MSMGNSEFNMFCEKCNREYKARGPMGALYQTFRHHLECDHDEA